MPAIPLGKTGTQFIEELVGREKLGLVGGHKVRSPFLCCIIWIFVMNNSRIFKFFTDEVSRTETAVTL